jgi:hypothetical protein
VFVPEEFLDLDLLPVFDSDDLLLDMSDFLMELMDIGTADNSGVLDVSVKLCENDKSCFETEPLVLHEVVEDYASIIVVKTPMMDTITLDNCSCAVKTDVHPKGFSADSDDLDDFSLDVLLDLNSDPGDLCFNPANVNALEATDVLDDTLEFVE